MRKRLLALLYRLRLGWLLGHRVLLLAYTSRWTGRRRYSVLRVWHYDPQLNESVVLVRPSARHTWYHDILTSPALALWIGGRRYVPVARRLSRSEVSHYLFAAAHARSQEPATLLGALGYRHDGSAEPLSSISHELRGVAFRPHQILY